MQDENGNGNRNGNGNGMERTVVWYCTVSIRLCTVTQAVSMAEITVYEAHVYTVYVPR